MATRTVFGLTGDTEDTLYGAPTGKDVEHQAHDRYMKIDATGNYVYPYRVFDAGFNIPYVVFMFLNAYGNRIATSPTVTLQLPGQFNVTGFSDYARTENIFGVTGDVYNTLAKDASASKLNDAITGVSDQSQIDSITGKLSQVGLSAAEAFQYSWKKAFANIEGWAGSLGLNNINQFEFMNRQAVNPMAQLLYRGPQMRRYQLPFTMKPKSEEDSKQIQTIMKIFRVASSPSVPNTSGTAIGGVNIGVGNAFTFGYPHLTQFDVYFVNEFNQIRPIYKSKICAIESISVDYGGQKMSFYRDGTPTDMAMTLQLSEVTPRTLGDAISESKKNMTLI